MEKTGRLVLGLIFIGAGALHLVSPGIYLRIMPPILSRPLELVYLSGALEMLGGVGLLVPETRRFASWGLVALLLVVWPANLYMAMTPQQFPKIPGWVLWARLPLQIPLIWWASIYGRLRRQAA